MPKFAWGTQRRKTFRISKFYFCWKFQFLFLYILRGSKSKYCAMYVFIWHELHIFIAHSNSKEGKKRISIWWEHKKSMGHSWKFYRSICACVCVCVHNSKCHPEAVALIKKKKKCMREAFGRYKFSLIDFEMRKTSQRIFVTCLWHTHMIFLLLVLCWGYKTIMPSTDPSLSFSHLFFVSFFFVLRHTKRVLGEKNASILCLIIYSE